MDELLHAGNIGLSKAIKKYDVNKGASFSTFAYMWVKSEL